MVEAGLVADWLAGRVLARGLPAPVVDRGGLRVDTGTEAEIARWVFPRPSPAITALTAAIARPGYAVRFAGAADALTALLAPGWRVESENCMMMLDRSVGAAGLPDGFAWIERRAGTVTHLRAIDSDGLPGASGYAAASGGAFVYDRVLVAPEHRRKGLGAALMAALGEYKPAGSLIDVLTATPAGRGLYAAIGWRVVSPRSAATSAGL